LAKLQENITLYVNLVVKITYKVYIFRVKYHDKMDFLLA